jgi:hypothetical protein
MRRPGQVSSLAAVISSGVAFAAFIDIHLNTEVWRCMAGRKAIPASLRWQVFVRDGFRCRYCGSQAGQDGVDLHADHVKSVADGGDNSYDNLVTACQQCNGGKGAKSLKSAPTPAEVIQRINSQTRTLHEQANAIAASVEAAKGLCQEIVNLKCAAYGIRSVKMDRNEQKIAGSLCREFGPDMVLEWYRTAAAKGVRDREAVQYVCGIARNVRERASAVGAS